MIKRFKEYFEKITNIYTIINPEYIVDEFIKLKEAYDCNILYYSGYYGEFSKKFNFKSSTIKNNSFIIICVIKCPFDSKDNSNYLKNIEREVELVKNDIEKNPKLLVEIHKKTGEMIPGIDYPIDYIVTVSGR